MDDTDSGTLLARMFKGQGHNSPGVVVHTDLQPISFNWMEGRTFKVHENCTNPLTASQTQAVLDGSVVRALTPLECERLQGFPDGWTEGFPKSARYRMMGNAVTVNVAEWIGRRIAAVDGRSELWP